MATHLGRLGTVKSGSNEVLELTSISVTETSDTVEDTAIGDTSRTYLAGLKTFTGSVECHYDPSDSTGQETFDVGSSVTVNFLPIGADTGDIQLSGTCIITEKTVNNDIDGTVTVSFSLQGTGALTQTTL